MIMKRCLQILYSLGRGGTETTVKNYLSSLAADDDIKFDVLVHKNVLNSYEEDIRDMGINIYQIDHFNQIGLFRYLKRLYLFLKEKKYDVVHIHMDAACGMISVVARQAKINKIICHSHTAGVRNLGGRMGVHINRIIFRIIKPVCLACGEKAGIAMYGKYPFRILNNGIDVNPFRRIDSSKNYTKQELSIPDDAKIILHVGRFDGPKNQAFIVSMVDDIVDNNPNTFFVFAGNGTCFDDVKRKALMCKHSDKIIFLGVVKNISQLMCDSDLFILPSVFEGFPVTLIEAQCAGLPCLVSDGVTQEADLSINKFRFLSLNKEIWVDTISEFLSFHKTEVFDNIEMLNKMGFTTESNSNFLKKIYLS